MIEAVLERAADRYRSEGRVAHGFARGKMRGDPAYAAVLEQLPEQGRLLDVGCGEGYLLALARTTTPALDLQGVDHDERRVDQGRRVLGDEPRLILTVGDIRTVPLPSADVVTCLDVLHYMPPKQQDEVIARLAGAVRPGGVLFLRDGEEGAGLRSTLLRWSETIAVALGRHKGDGVFFRPAQALRERLEAAGLRVEVAPCAEGTPFANLLFVARRP